MKPKPPYSLPFFLTLGLPLKARIFVGAIVPLLAAALHFSSTYVSHGHLRRMTHQILNDRMEMMRSAGQVKQTLVSYDDALFRFLATHDSEQLVEGRRFKTTAIEEIELLSQLSASPRLTKRLNVLKEETDQYFKDAERLLQFAQNTPGEVQDIGRRSAGWSRNAKDAHLELAFLSAEGKARLIRIFSLCDEIITVNGIALEQAQKDMDALLDKTRTRELLLNVFSAGILLLVMAGFVLSVIYPMGELMQGVHKIEQGDLDVQIPVTTSDEVGELTEAFNRATRTIREQREQLWRESITDHLTGAYNQRHFRKMLVQEMERAKRAGTSLSLLMIDIDHFKTYNDSHGHEFGNEVIRKVVEIVRQTLRQTDLIARYGGDELAVLLPETGMDHAQVLARRLLEEVTSFQFPSFQGNEPPKISISLGGACFPANSNVMDELVRKADEALYAAKKGGRARVHWAGSPVPVFHL